MEGVDWRKVSKPRSATTVGGDESGQRLSSWAEDHPMTAPAKPSVVLPGWRGKPPASLYQCRTAGRAALLPTVAQANARWVGMGLFRRPSSSRGLGRAP